MKKIDNLEKIIEKKVKTLDLSKEKGKYISDKCNFPEIIRNLPDGSCVEIVAQTGLGKTSSIKDLAISNENKNILILEPRLALLDQVHEDIKKTKIANIDTVSYQKVSSDFQKALNKDEDTFNDIDINILEKYLQYDYIIYDEHQMILKDSSFNLGMLFILKFIEFIKVKSNSKQLFLTANHIEDKYNIVLSKCSHRIVFSNTLNLYDLRKRVKQAFLVEHNQRLHSLLAITKMYENDKHLIHVRSNKEAEIIYQMLNEKYPGEVNLICSKNNKNNLHQYMDDEALKIVNQEKLLPGRILIITNVAAYGVSFEDPGLKHIHLNDYDFDILYQIIGRKRLDPKLPDDRINLYFTDADGRSVRGALKTSKNMIKSYENLINSPQEFVKNNGEDFFVNILHYAKVCEDSKGKEIIKLEGNHLLYCNLKYQVANLKKIINHKNTIQFLLKEKFKLNPTHLTFLTNKELQLRETVFNSLAKYHKNETVFYDKTLKDSFAKELNIKNEYGRLIKAMKSLNKEFKRLKIPYKITTKSTVISFEDNKKKKRYRSAWIIETIQ